MSNAEYFKAFKPITYNGYKVKDIMRRTKITETWEKNPYMFLPYTVEADQTAEDVAYNYYGNPHLVWLVYLANGIINPFEDWVMPTKTFHSYLAMKYKEQSGLEEMYEIVNWTKTQTQFYVCPKEVRINNLSYELLPDDKKPNFTPISIYDYEDWKNESKRNIRLVNADLADNAIKELRDKLYV